MSDSRGKSDMSDSCGMSDSHGMSDMSDNRGVSDMSDSFDLTFIILRVPNLPRDSFNRIPACEILYSGLHREYGLHRECVWCIER